MCVFDDIGHIGGPKHLKLARVLDMGADDDGYSTVLQYTLEKSRTTLSKTFMWGICWVTR